MSAPVYLICCACGESAGRHEQHWNRDAGYGICPACVAWVRSRGSSDSEMLSLYGVAGVNYETPADNSQFAKETK